MAHEKALAREQADLAKADHDIAAGERRIAQQIELIAHLRLEGRDTRQALLLLETFRQSLQAWCDHRTLIINRIEYLR